MIILTIMNFVAKIQALIIFVFTFQYKEHLTLVCRETVALLATLLHGTRTWVVMAARLIFYAMLLLPGWIRMLSYWLFDDGVLRNVEFGKGSLARNVLDVYLPVNSTKRAGNKKLQKDGEGAPVVVFVGGGVWIIGNKLWSTLVARGLTMLGYLVIVPDYRNFPQAGIEEMCDDLTSCLVWTVENCWHYGGNKDKLTLAGQSAGAHIVLCTILRLFEGKSIPASPIVAASEDPLRTELSELIDDSFLSDHMDLGTRPLLKPGSPGFFNRIFAPNSPDNKAPASAETSFVLEEDLQLLGQQQVRGQRKPEEAGDDSDASTVASSDDEGAGLTWTEKSPRWQKKAPSRKSSQNSTPKSCLYRSGSSDGLDEGYIYFMGGETTASDGQGQGQGEATRDLALLRAVKQLVLINGPFDMCSLQSHLHSRGLDSQILRWIFRSDFEHYSPTRRIHELAKTVPSVAAKEGRDRELSWEDFPAVAIVSCLEDKSIPVDQARGLYRALTSVTDGDSADSSAALGVCLVEYPNLSHTSLVVEGPLEGDGTLFQDFDAIVRLTDGSGKLALSSFTSLTARPESKKKKKAPFYTPMAPALLVALAKWINPF